MEYIEIAIKVIIAFSIINVWLFRKNQPTQWRGGDANSLKEEFERYGLSQTVMYIVGTLKVILSLLLVASIWIPILELPAAGGIALLMMGAIAMHIKISDPFKRSIPALLFLILSLLTLFV